MKIPTKQAVRMLAQALPLLLAASLAHATEPMPPLARLQAARAHVQALMRKHDQESEAILKAYADKDSLTLEKTATRIGRAPGFQDPDRFMRDEYAPYLKCDTAQVDLGILAGAMARYAARNTPALSNIVATEQADYERSLQICKQRLSVAPAAAWAQYQAE
jgi:hypothetical protein